ncbi:M57 family metalloprotease [Flagellimonas zhangzhouensis]|uniref:Dual-action HEIGH metallo-peptidase n=1 Tax=Flagellimonas zhangzhouensis TaxID=1073328 RepID=A0A1H2QTT4_9FLAO|nr:M57 family metalloprotease [Allomuricauda zhangzhouensis]SDQ56132.1 Dual-action HEIGH metallo-peptidase [Allomuricauda zhangzhouensis]SDW09859.1 Dual-action HEIGH metallo-peptidase [Allomuricauda zhangzhouensis]
MKKLFLLSSIAICVLTSCSEDHQNLEQTPSSINYPEELSNSNKKVPDSLQHLKEYLINDLKFKEDDIAFKNNEFILEDDMTISIEGLLYTIDFIKQQGIDLTAHYASNGCGAFSPSPVHAEFCPGKNCSHDDEIYEIAVDISGSVPFAWRQATINAMNNWNNLQNNRFTFILEDRNCDIRAWDGIEVYLYSSNNSATLASASLPAQVPGYAIKINTNSLSYASNNIPLFTRVMMHEFGHTIGYRHTDKTDGCFIPGSANSDGASLMNSLLIPNYIGQGFSNADINAHNLLYPSANNSARFVEFKCRI